MMFFPFGCVRLFGIEERDSRLRVRQENVDVEEILCRIGRRQTPDTAMDCCTERESYVKVLDARRNRVNSVLHEATKLPIREKFTPSRKFLHKFYVKYDDGFNDEFN